ncbi:Diaminopimelate epimerase [Commensalibacter sp. Nvir]|uniref:diaminopimelate epimerase n=1 Tax=Commensalibacter sp. Nvir TaxID=3069817 RepID=UPI002D4CF13B|nr:Diaminopimelate epimerase [Commensalibacter sp. Nvir]
MNIPFYKMHGIGNDFVVIDNSVNSISLNKRRVKALCDRRYGIGCDQLIVLSNPKNDLADVYVQFFNGNGDEAGACGNGSRCVIAWLYRKYHRTEFILQTNAGLLPAQVIDSQMVKVNMGQPRTKWRDIPLKHEADTLYLPLAGEPSAVSIGNPHVTFFVEDLSTVDPVFCGKVLEKDPLFVEGANISFVQMLDRQAMRVRVWERGSGLTLACGSGACASVVNAVRRGLADRHCQVKMDGGNLIIDWDAENNEVLMTGPTSFSYQGSFDLDHYPL